jgi:hypothetical protein
MEGMGRLHTACVGLLFFSVAVGGRVTKRLYMGCIAIFTALPGATFTGLYTTGGLGNRLGRVVGVAIPEHIL